ncbi:HAD-IB family hydrolase [Arhodomonas aquaeolei]|uniref:histidinol-phosphatase n=1 Tax=Arhodomonas aquaeolei TaxID=2369 RepID=UPI0021685EC2|nr:HAD family hydrolase [Arhodomonas aquaeolei]MCS4504207.1 HAD-IB family hydrolase [Arhodomonas aquaeolei]
MSLTLFDLDNTLLAGDSDHLWGEYLTEHDIVDAQTYAAANERFYADYKAGRLDIDAFLRFALRPLAEHPPEQLHAWRERFIAEKIEPIVLPAARALIDMHRQRGDTLVIITATNRFVTEPIAGLLGIDCLLATEPEFRDGRYTGGYVGTPTFRDGKIAALEAWRRQSGTEDMVTTFYSDSRNDLPLLERVEEPVAVDPDPALDAIARERHWQRLTLRDGPEPHPLG